VTAERALAAAALAACLGAAWAEHGSEFAARVRQAKPWPAWVEARPPGAALPSFHLAVYDPMRRRLSVLHLPGETRLEGRRTLERAYREALKASGDPSSAARAAEDLAGRRLSELSPESFAAPTARLLVVVPALSNEDEPALEAARALKDRARSLRVWLGLLGQTGRGLLRADRSGLDLFLFALEMRRVPVERLESARLPGDAAAASLLGRLLSNDLPPSDGKATTAEVLNGSGKVGLASRASKMLRLGGVDVMAMGAARERARTLVYDRVGDFRRAAGAREALGCPPARAVTRVDPSRAVDVSVELGRDCAEAFERGGAAEP